MTTQHNEHVFAFVSAAPQEAVQAYVDAKPIDRTVNQSVEQTSVETKSGEKEKMGGTIDAPSWVAYFARHSLDETALFSWSWNWWDVNFLQGAAHHV